MNRYTVIYEDLLKPKMVRRVDVDSDAEEQGNLSKGEVNSQDEQLRSDIWRSIAVNHSMEPESDLVRMRFKIIDINKVTCEACLLEQMSQWAHTVPGGCMYNPDEDE